MNHDNPRSNFFAMLRSIEALPPVVIDGVEYSGVYLAQVVSVRYDPPAEAADNTPQLVYELGAIVARAKRQKDLAEVDYRIWRDTIVHRMTNDVNAAREAGFECAANPGVDAKGKEKDPKTPAASVVEAYLRTLPEYRAHYVAQAEAERAWSTVHAAWEAAKLRTLALNVSSRWGLRSPETAGDNTRTSPGPDYQPQLPDPPRHAATPPGSQSSEAGPPAPPQLPPPPPPIP